MVQLPLPMSDEEPTVKRIANVNRRWIFLLVVTIFLGLLGVHRFSVGKIGTGVLWLLTTGLLGIGWLVDIVQVVTGNFTDKAGRRITRDPNTTARTAQRKTVPAKSGSLEFIDLGAEPERDHAGRVIARLKTGSQLEIDLRDFRDRDEVATESFLQPRKKGELGDEGQKTVRMRLVPTVEDYWGGKCFRIETPNGASIFEIRDYFPEDFTLAEKVVSDIYARLRGTHSTVAEAAFVFDVPVQIDFQWVEELNDEGEETDGVEFDWDAPVLRLKDPLEIEIRPAQA